jgi:diacylglycerol kinase (ATP)
LIAVDNAHKLDMGQVKTRKGRKFAFFELATVGLAAAVYPDAAKAASGKLSGVKNAVMTLIHQDAAPKVFLTLDGESKIEVETMLVMVSNTPAFGKKFLVAPDASVEDGLLDISVYQNFSKTELLGYYAKVMDGGYSGDGKVQRYQAHKLQLKSSPKLKVMADGTELGKGTVTIKLHTGALRVITPERIPRPSKPQKDGAASTTVPVPAAAGSNHREKLPALGQ